MRERKNWSRDGRPFLTFPEVQSYLGIKSRKTILKYIRTGRLPAYKLAGTRWRIASKDVQAFLRHQRIRNTNPSEVRT